MKGKRSFRGRNQYETELFEKLNAMEGKYDLRDIFQGFVQYCALYISNLCDGVHFEDRQRDMEVLMQKYKGISEQFRGCTQLLAKAIQYNVERDLFQDILGTVYESVGLSNERNGQFFTPESVSTMMAKILTGDKIHELKEKPYITTMEPCVGSGRMVLAFASELQNSGYNYCSQFAVFAVDNDSFCAAMAYVQFSLYGIPAVVVHGDSLCLKEWSRWYTPIYVWGGWIFRETFSLSENGAEDDKKLKIYSIERAFLEAEKIKAAKQEKVS